MHGSSFHVNWSLCSLWKGQSRILNILPLESAEEVELLLKKSLSDF